MKKDDNHPTSLQPTLLFEEWVGGEGAGVLFFGDLDVLEEARFSLVAGDEHALPGRDSVVSFENC